MRTRHTVAINQMNLALESRITSAVQKKKTQILEGRPRIDESPGEEDDLLSNSSTTHLQNVGSRVNLNRDRHRLRQRPRGPQRDLSDYIKDYEQNRVLSMQKHQEIQARQIQPVYLFKKELKPNRSKVGLRPLASMQRLSQHESPRSRSKFVGESGTEQSLRYPLGKSRNGRQYGAVAHNSVDFESQTPS